KMIDEPERLPRRRLGGNIDEDVALPIAGKPPQPQKGGILALLGELPKSWIDAFFDLKDSITRGGEHGPCEATGCDERSHLLYVPQSREIRRLRGVPMRAGGGAWREGAIKGIPGPWITDGEPDGSPRVQWRCS